MCQFNFHISHQEYLFILDVRKSLLLHYEVQELDCQQCKAMNPANDLPEQVEAKVKLLNSYYSTRVVVDPMVSNIVKLSKMCNLDTRISQGDVSVVPDIACTNRDNFSFATKYCSLLQPDYYPIIDNYVWKFLKKLNELGFFDKSTKKKFANVNKNHSKAYQDYVDIYDEFIDKSGLKPYFKNYREVDSYIWSAAKIYLLIQKTSEHTQNSPYEQWLGTFAATVLANLTSTAIWTILTIIFK